MKNNPILQLILQSSKIQSYFFFFPLFLEYSKSSSMKSTFTYANVPSNHLIMPSNHLITLELTTILKQSNSRKSSPPTQALRRLPHIQIISSFHIYLKIIFSSNTSLFTWFHKNVPIKQEVHPNRSLP